MAATGWRMWTVVVPVSVASRWAPLVKVGIAVRVFVHGAWTVA